jgi:probable HAF family extracellular repeat protein
MTSYSYTTIDPPGSGRTDLFSINEAGQIVGLYVDSNGHYQGFLDEGGIYTTINLSGSDYTIPSSINDSGQVIGSYADSTQQKHGFLYSCGAYTTIDPPGSVHTVAESINASGQIVGYYQDSSGHAHGFLDTAGIYTVLDVPGAYITTADSINDSGQIVGNYTDATGGHGFLYSGGSYTTIRFRKNWNHPAKHQLPRDMFRSHRGSRPREPRSHSGGWRHHLKSPERQLRRRRNGCPGHFVLDAPRIHDKSLAEPL